MSYTQSTDQIQKEPQWLEGQHCMDCNTKFNISHRKHHWYVYIAHVCHGSPLPLSPVVTVGGCYATSAPHNKFPLSSLTSTSPLGCVKCATIPLELEKTCDNNRIVIITAFLSLMQLCCYIIIFIVMPCH